MADVILIVDDERDLVENLAYRLGREGFETRAAYDGRAALHEARRFPHPSLILLDLMLPEMSGTDVIRQLKQSSELARIPVVMLTAKDEEVDRIVGFELGADDYVTKPFSTRELVLRCRAVLRRSGESEVPIATIGPLSLDHDAHQAFVDGEPVALTALEFKLLETLARRHGRVQSRETLLQDVWDMRGDLTTRTVDTHVKRLRRKLKAAGTMIETLRGVGYRLRHEDGE